MSYSIWLDGNRIGDTNLELPHGTDRRGGVFHPTEFGLTVLPGITSMAPALLDVGRLCRDHGIDFDSPDLDVDGLTEDLFRTPEGHRLFAARPMALPSRCSVSRPRIPQPSLTLCMSVPAAVGNNVRCS